MALASTAAQSLMLNALDTVLAYVSLHSATPGTTGASELSGGGYARQAATFTTSTTGSARTNTAALTFSTSGATAVTHTGSFTASTAGTYGVGTALTSSVTAASIVFAAGAISYTAS